MQIECVWRVVATRLSVCVLNDAYNEGVARVQRANHNVVRGVDRDINAALNIRQKGILELKAAGLVVSAYGGQRKSVAQTVAA